MIRWIIILMSVSLWCFGSVAEAADLPSTVENPISHRAKALVKAKTLAVKTKKTVTKLPRVSIAADDNQVAANRAAESVPKNTEIDMSWVLDPLVANSDGGKKEGSASVESILVVVQPGYVSLPYMIIELTGHIVKTAHTTVRLDVRIGDVNRTVSWKPEDVQAGKFKIELKAPLQEGKLPDNFPVSALAIVTKDSQEGAAMVSLEQIVVRLGKVRIAEAQ